MPKLSGEHGKIIRAEGEANAREAVSAYSDGLPGLYLPGTRKRITLRHGMSFHELRQVLMELGFREGRHLNGFQSFQEETSGAMVLLPEYQKHDHVLRIHLNTLRKLLIEKSLVESV
ncbi:MAG: hypothetical protein K0R39_1200 [Symbiobacteriaceae bacterium]|nr:hypothetical protein [Symbiobacteriaceae bacterium]